MPRRQVKNANSDLLLLPGWERVRGSCYCSSASTRDEQEPHQNFCGHRRLRVCCSEGRGNHPSAQATRPQPPGPAVSSLAKIHMKAICSPSAAGQWCKEDTEGEEQGARAVWFSSNSTGGSFSLLLRKLRLSNQIFALEYLPESHQPSARSVWKVSGLQPLLTPECSQPS